MISVAKGQALLFGMAPRMDLEQVPLRQANGRVFHGTVTADRDQPPFSSSAMDGYAVIQDGRSDWHVVGESAAGRGHGHAIGPGQAVRIFTGAPVPPNADRIVIQEDVTVSGDTITLGPDADTRPYIRPAGGDFQAGFAIHGPKVIGPADISLMAAMNAPVLPVARCPDVAIIATGDELVQPGEAPALDQIIASNALALAALVESAGATTRILPIAKDRTTALTQAFEWAGTADLVITIGGASVGDHDLVGAVARTVGFAPEFYKLAMRPGKPLMAGKRGQSVHVGLPGNPVSSLVCGHVFIVPLIKHMLGHPAPMPTYHTATLAKDMGPNGPRAHYMRACLDGDQIAPFDRQDSSLMHILTQANALLVRAPNEPEQPAGASVPYLNL
ncbi:MAG: molybdopterin molybdotransferase MoeA [Pseudomonadota bacterium]